MACSLSSHLKYNNISKLLLKNNNNNNNNIPKLNLVTLTRTSDNKIVSSPIFYFK